MALFESYERRIAQINKFLNDNGIASIEEAEQITKGKGLDIYKRVKDIQPICFENACWAYLVGAAVAIKRGQTVASEIAKTLGEGLQSFCIPGSVADQRQGGIGHGNLGAMLIDAQCAVAAVVSFLRPNQPENQPPPPPPDLAFLFLRNSSRFALFSASFSRIWSVIER